jgi:integrase
MQTTRPRFAYNTRRGWQRVGRKPQLGVFKRKNKYWIDFYDSQKNRIQESSHSSSKRDAEDLLSIRKSEVLRGTFKRPVKIAFGELGTRYMEYAKANKRSWLRDEQMFGSLTAFLGSERQLREISPADIEGFKLHRRKEVSGSTVNRELALLKHMLNLAIDWDLYLGSNPVRKVKYFQEVNTGFRTLSKEEEKKFLAHATPYIQDIATFDLNTGLRIGEILSLTWESVDLEKNLLSVFAHKTNKIRVVPINAEARRVLSYWALGKKSQFVFYNHETGKPFVDLKAGFALACRKAGIEGVTWHTLRHTFASRLVARGVDIVTVQQLLGHSSITVTMRYTHTNLDAKRNATQKLEDFSDNLVTPCTKLQQLKPKVSPIAPLKAAASYT